MSALQAFCGLVTEAWKYEVLRKDEIGLLLHVYALPHQDTPEGAGIILGETVHVSHTHSRVSVQPEAV